MRLLRTLVASSALFAAASVANAQGHGTLKFESSPPNPAVTGYGYYVGPFTATLLSDPTTPQIDLYCVDFLNHISFGQVWNASFTNLAGNDFSLTRHGSAQLPDYKKAAYLTSLYNAPGVATSDWAGIQSAVWNLLNPGSLNGGAPSAYWLAQANTWYGSAAAQTFDYGKYTIVTDVGAAGLRQGGGTQEFLTTAQVTPEPETFILMGTGLLAIAGLAVARGRLG